MKTAYSNGQNHIIQRLIFTMTLILITSNLVAQIPNIYGLHSYGNGVKNLLFVSLSDVYQLSDEDTLALPPACLTPNDDNDMPYAQLQGVYRQRLLSSMHMSESDKLYVYHFSTDSLAVFNIKDLTVIAVLSPYFEAYNNRISPLDYMIGFNIEEKALQGFGNDAYNSLVSIGKVNPFVGGGIKPMIWSTISDSEFPAKVTLVLDTNGLPLGKAGNYVKFSNDGLDYYAEDVQLDQFRWQRHLVVTKANSKMIIYDKLFIDDEGSSLAPLSSYGNTEDVFQWTGVLFKDKPPIILGFQSISFGCPNIPFIDKNIQPLPIFCDNRH